MSSIFPRAFSIFFFNHPATTEISTLSLHDALPISARSKTLPSTRTTNSDRVSFARATTSSPRSEEHTSELQSHVNLVCRLLLEKKKKREQSTMAQETENGRD